MEKGSDLLLKNCLSEMLIFLFWKFEKSDLCFLIFSFFLSLLEMEGGFILCFAAVMLFMAPGVKGSNHLTFNSNRPVGFHST